MECPNQSLYDRWVTIDALLKYPLVFAAAFAVTYFLVPLVRDAASRLNIVDHPGDRRLNRTAVPRGGGVAVFIGFHAACAVTFLAPWGSFAGALDIVWWQQFLSASAIIVVVGLIDDAQGLSALMKLFAQCAVALLLFSTGSDFGAMLGLEAPVLVNLFLTVGWFVFITNAFNLIDGLDGLAAGLASIASIGLAGALLFRSQPADALVLIGLIGACLAFLRYNFYPASVYLGDSGSLFLGFALATISLSTGLKGTALASIGVPLLAVGVPIFDTMLAVWRRSLRRMIARDDGTAARRGLMSADMDHLHHRLLRLGFTQRRAAVFLYLLNFALVGVGLLSLAYRSHSVGIFLIAFVVGAYIVVRHLAHVELWDSGRLILAGLRRPSGGVLTAMLYPVLDFFVFALAQVAALYMTHVHLDHGEIKELWRDSFPLWGGMSFLAMAFARSYSRVWSRARVSEFVGLVFALLAAVLLSASVTLIAGLELTRTLQLQTILYFFLAGGGILGLRAFPRAVEDAMSLIATRSKLRSEGSKRVLVIGAKDGCLSFLRNVMRSADTAHVVGLVAEARNLRKRWVHGYRVLGAVSELPAVVEEFEVDEIVISEPLSDDMFAFVVRFAQSTGVSLRRWQFSLRTIGTESEALKTVHEPHTERPAARSVTHS